MKILILANNDGGLYLFRKELLDELVKNNDVFCCIPNSDGFVDRIEALGCVCDVFEMDRHGTNPFKEIGVIRHYISLIRSFDPDLVLTYTIKCNVYGGLACQITKTPYISNITGLGTTIENPGIIKKLSLFLYKIGLRRASCVFFQNENNRVFFTSNKIVNGHTRLLPGSGVNTRFHTLEPYPGDENGFRFLFVGRVMRDKGIGELLDAFAKLSQNNSVFLNIVGGYDEDYAEQIEKCEESGKVKYHGKQADVHQFYKDAHCVVLPSYHEGMANVMLEAASTGRPVIGTDIPGVSETFDEGVTGLGCEPRSAESLYNSMKRMFELPNKIRKEMGIAGHNKMEHEFDRQIIVDSYLEEIDSAIKH